MEYTKTFGTGDASIEITVFDQPMEHNIVGLLTSKLFENPMGLVQDEEAKSGEEFCPAYLGILRENHGIVLMSKSLIDKLRQGDRMAEMVMLHEVGHYVHGDYREKHTIDRNLERLQCLQQGEVSQIELQADAFASEYLGEDAVVLALKELQNYFIENFRGCNKWDASSIEEATKEIELRIEQIKREGASQ